MTVESEAKHILVIYTGGTIGMKKNAKGAYVPMPDVFGEKIRTDSDINVSTIRDYFEVPSYSPEQPQIFYKIKEYSPLMDSSNMSPENWMKITHDVQEEYNSWDGIVILHGTDTLGYTASALSFMIRNIKKPIILTGSQISIFEIGSDAKSNFLTALRFASMSHINEICVVFANKLLRGNRTIKSSSESKEAFSSPNFPNLGEIGVNVGIDKRFLLDHDIATPSFYPHLNENVVILRIFPTITDNMLRYVLKEPTQGVILLSYGAGNIPSRAELKKILKDAVSRGIVIVNLTQCTRGTVNAIYETGKVLEEVGVMSGYDMTVEAAFTKMCHVLGLKDISFTQKMKMMQENLCGELTH